MTHSPWGNQQRCLKGGHWILRDEKMFDNVKKKKKVEVLVSWSYLILCDLMDYSPPGYSALEFSWQEYWSGLLFPPPGDLSTQGSTRVSCSPCIGRWILYHWATWEASSLSLWHVWWNSIIYRRSTIHMKCTEKDIPEKKLKVMDKTPGDLINLPASPGHIRLVTVSHKCLR